MIICLLYFNSKQMNLKVVFSYIFFALIFLFGSCKKIDKLTQFDMDYNETISIASTIGINLPFNLITPNITTNSQETFAINDTRKDLIENIQLTQMRLNLFSPVGEDFSFLKSIEIYIGAEGLSEIKVAWIKDIDNSIGNTLHLSTSSSNLKEYIKKDEFYLNVTSVTDELILSDHEMEVLSTFFVDAKILGI